MIRSGENGWDGQEPRASSSAWRLVARDVAIGGEIAPEREVGFASRTSAELVRSGERSVGEGRIRVDGVDGRAPRVGVDALGDLESHREGRWWSYPRGVKRVPKMGGASVKRRRNSKWDPIETPRMMNAHTKFTS